MSTSAKDIFEGIKQGVSSGIETAKKEIESKKTDEPSKVSIAANKAVNAIKNASSSVTSNVKEAIASATERTELWNTNLAGFDLTNVKFFKDTGNIGSELLEPGSIFNSELMVITDISEKKALGLPNLFFHKYSYGHFDEGILELYKFFFDIKIDTETNEDIDYVFCTEAFSITNIIPAELKIRGSYCELSKKGELHLVPVYIEEDEIEDNTNAEEAESEEKIIEETDEGGIISEVNTNSN